ncbi:hypothetical protein BGZ54_006997 [Gamsiella multidivaricata]|nr:hypothetical protein BGZ54_006997 [Gamsiella multidivaricata]
MRITLTDSTSHRRTAVAAMETGGFHGQQPSAAVSDPDDSPFHETSSSSTTIPASTRRYSVAGVIRSIFHAVLVQDTEHLDHVLTSLSLDPNKVRDREGKTMLMVAATENKHRVLRYLLALPNINANLQDDEGETALYQAAAAGSTECVQLLLLAGASASRGNEEAITPLIIASYNGFVSICRLLISIGHADVNQQDNTQKSALLLASYAGHVDVMAELLDHGASLNTLDQYGWSALMLAAYAGKLEACKLLLAHNADPYIKTANGKDARSLSWDAGHKSIAVYISKFLSRRSNVPASSSGQGPSMSSRGLIQQISPTAPRSPSRRTHSPAPSLPSVPEEGHEDITCGTQRSSFSIQNSTISHQSILSSRRHSRRPHPLLIPPAPPRADEEPVSPIPTAMASSHLVDMFNAPRENSFAEPSLDGTSSAFASLTQERSMPEILSTVAPTSAAAEAEKLEHRTMPSQTWMPTLIYSIYRHGLIPRYGSRRLLYFSENQPEVQPEVAIPVPANPSTLIQQRFRPHRLSNHSHSERVKEKDMENELNQRLLRRHQMVERSRNSSWVALAMAITMCCPARVLPKAWSKSRRQDWREKVALGVLMTGLSVLFGFLAFGFALLTCRPHLIQDISMLDFNGRYGNSSRAVESGRFAAIRGRIYDIGKIFSDGHHPLAAGSNITQATFSSFLSTHYDTDISFLFPPADLVQTCHYFGAATSFGKCSPAGSASINHCHQSQASRDLLRGVLRDDIRVIYNWADIQDQIARGRATFVYDGSVFDATDYLAQFNSSIMIEERVRMDWIRSLVGRDATLMVQRQPDHKEISKCFEGFFRIGVLSGQPSGCIASIVINILALAMLLLITIMRLASALIYRWIFSQPLLNNGRSNVATEVGTKDQNHVLMLVICPTGETEDRIKATLNSLVLTDHEDSRKMLLVIVDATSSDGEPCQASSSCLGLMDTSFMNSSDNENAVRGGLGPEREVDSIALDDIQSDSGGVIDDASVVHSGHYVIDARRVPYILVIRPPRDHLSQPHHGNWEKKKLVVRWLHRVCFNQPISALEYDLFERVRDLNHHGPGIFEMLLMTEVGSVCDRHSVTRLVDTLENNERVIGASGQGMVENSSQNWLTWTQDYEHHLSLQFTNAFESTTGAVQCLPSRFSLVRIKVKLSDKYIGPGPKTSKRHSDHDSIVSATDDVKDGHENEEHDTCNRGTAEIVARHRIEKDQDRVEYAIPVLVHPDVVSSYVDHRTHTLHDRSLVLDGGEDRYLTGLLHSAFPDRRIVYQPYATYGFTVTADLSAYLLQQRLLLTSSFHTYWVQMWSPRLRGVFCCSINCLAMKKWLKLVLGPAMAILTCATLVIVVIGAVTNVGALYSLPTVLALAFMLSATLLQPILGVCLGRRTILKNVVGFCMYMVTLPCKSIGVALLAYWHLDDHESSAETSPEPSAVGRPQAGMTTTPSATRYHMVRYWAEWNSMKRHDGLMPLAAQAQAQAQAQTPERD